MISQSHKTITLGLLILISTFRFCNAQSEEANYELSQKLYEQGNYKQALGVIDRAMSYDSSKADYFMLRANIYFQLAQYDKTITDYYKILRIQPQMPEVYLLRGKVCVVTESYGGAILFFGKAIKYSSDNEILFDAFLNKGRAYFEMRKYHDALASYKSAREIDPYSSELLLLMADTQIQIEEYAAASDNLIEVIDNDPDNARAYEILGRLALQKEDYTQAIIAFEKYSKLDPSHEAYMSLARTYFIIEDYAKAMNVLNKAIVLDSSDPEAYQIKGLIYIEQGNKEMGCDHLFQAMQLGYFEKYGYELLDVYLKLCEDLE